MKFAKLFDLENDNQVLLTIEYKEEENIYEMVCRANVEGCITQIVRGYKTEEIAVKNMEKFTIEQAIIFRETMISIF